MLGKWRSREGASTLTGELKGPQEHVRMEPICQMLDWILSSHLLSIPPRSVCYAAVVTT